MTEGLVVTPTALRSRVRAIRALPLPYPTPIIPGIILIPRGTYYSQNYSRIIDAGLLESDQTLSLLWVGSGYETKDYLSHPDKIS